MTETTLMTQTPETTEPDAPPTQPGAAEQGAQPAAAERTAPDPAAQASRPQPTEEGRPGHTLPEKYEDFTMPDGVTLDAQAADELKSMAKEAKLSQHQAQRFADLGAKMMQRWQDQHTQTLQQAHQQWVSDAQRDQEFGGDKLAENLGIAKQALDAFGTPQLTQLLNDSGLGNHPEVIRAFYRIGIYTSSK